MEASKERVKVLKRKDIKILKKAASVIFHEDSLDGGYCGLLVCHHKGGGKHIECWWYLDCPYHRDMERGDHMVMALSCKLQKGDPKLEAVLGMLRPGDSISMRARCNHKSEITILAEGLWVETLELQIEQQGQPLKACLLGVRIWDEKHTVRQRASSTGEPNGKDR